jgi:hypothetical protein
MVVKLCAVLLVALCLLPNTAPFQTLVLADFPTSRHGDAVVDVLATQTSAADPDDNDVLVLERPHSLIQSHVGALTAVVSYDAAAVLGLFRPSIALTTVVFETSPRKAVLRL